MEGDGEDDVHDENGNEMYDEVTWGDCELCKSLSCMYYLYCTALATSVRYNVQRKRVRTVSCSVDYLL